jgi:hypothetical protein
MWRVPSKNSLRGHIVERGSREEGRGIIVGEKITLPRPLPLHGATLPRVLSIRVLPIRERDTGGRAR